MKIPVPLYKSWKDTDCGPLVLKMSLAYLGENYSYKKISKQERQVNTGLVWSVGIARASKRLGFPTKFTTINFNSEQSDNEYYNNYCYNEAKAILKELSDEIKKIGVEIQEKDMDLKELLSYVSEKSIPIVLLNWYVVEGFNGHFLPVTGYDEKNIYVHNPGVENAKAYLPIRRTSLSGHGNQKGLIKIP